MNTAQKGFTLIELMIVVAITMCYWMGEVVLHCYLLFLSTNDKITGFCHFAIFVIFVFWDKFCHFVPPGFCFVQQK